MSAFWYTYSLQDWEIELDSMEKELDEEHRDFIDEDLALSRYEEYLFDEKQKFYEDFAAVDGIFLKFDYVRPSYVVETRWCEPNFRCYDPLGLFFRFLNEESFLILKTKIFKIANTPYSALGDLSINFELFKTLFGFAERWCEIHVLYYEGRVKYNYKLTLWVASRILKFVND